MIGRQRHISLQVPVVCHEESLLLWRTWYEKGQQGLEDRDYPHAVEWLQEALLHIGVEAPHAHRLARTEASLAYALFRNYESLEECAKDPCMPEARKKRYQEIALKHLQESCCYAEKSLPCLNESYQRAHIARGRAEFVLGMNCFLKQEYKSAEAHFLRAFQALYRIGSQVELMIDVLKHAFRAAYDCGDYVRAKFHLKNLEAELANLPDRPLDISWLLICQAAVLLHLGQYQQADALRSRWESINRRCAEGYHCSLHCAQALAIFGRARLMLGYYAEAEADLKRSKRISEILPKRDFLLEFDIALARGELSRRSGDYGCAKLYLDYAKEMLEYLEKVCNPYLRERHILFWLARGDYFLAVGDFQTACGCYEGARKRAELECKCVYFLLVPALLGEARIENMRSQIPQSLVIIRRALNCLEESKATLTPEMAHALHELAFSYLHDNKPDQAEPLCEKSLQILTLSLRNGHPDSAEILLTQAQSIASQHHCERALTIVDRAEQIMQQNTPRDLFAMARLLRVRAEIYHAQRDVPCALRVLVCALRLWEEQEHRVAAEVIAQAKPAGPYQHPEKALLFLWLAIGHLHFTELPTANDYLKPLGLPLLNKADPEKINVGPKRSCLAKNSLLLKIKCSQEYVGYELNRLGNQLFKHKLYLEAQLLYALAAQMYYCACGLEYSSTHAAIEHWKQAFCYRSELPEELCPCSPCFIPCADRLHPEPCKCHLCI